MKDVRVMLNGECILEKRVHNNAAADMDFYASLFGLEVEFSEPSLYRVTAWDRYGSAPSIYETVELELAEETAMDYLRRGYQVLLRELLPDGKVKDV